MCELHASQIVSEVSKIFAMVAKTLPPYKETFTEDGNEKEKQFATLDEYLKETDPSKRLGLDETTAAKYISAKEASIRLGFSEENRLKQNIRSWDLISTSGIENRRRRKAKSHHI